MRKSRRKFLKLLGISGVSLPFIINNNCEKNSDTKIVENEFSNDNKSSTFKNFVYKSNTTPLVISTWKHGLAANAEALRILRANGKALDAVEAGVIVSENDPEVSSVGYGGLPDANGEVTLDACIMDHFGECGSVGCLRRIRNPISVARSIMEDTRHVMLVGEEATKYAISKGFKEENLLSENAKLKYLKWKEDNTNKIENNHDTIGMIALDKHGNIAGACTTSGLGYKLPGRVGDSPIIGAGMYVDNDIGGAAATGVGEEVIKVCGSFAVVENMRRGMSPNEAIRDVLQRVAKRLGNNKEMQVCFIALRKDGVYSGGSLSKKYPLVYALGDENTNKLIEDTFVLFD